MDNRARASGTGDCRASPISDEGIGRLAHTRRRAHGVLHGVSSTFKGAGDEERTTQTGDLFEEIRVVELRPELRGRLTPLLPALLAAAARLEPRQTPPNGLGSVKASDHQDHG